MAGRKKSETQPSSSRSTQIPLPSAKRRPSGGSIVSAFCPICGRTCPEYRVISRTSYGAAERQPYFESIDWDPKHPFGLRLSAAGKGSLQDWDYINPDDAPELFKALKGRFIDAVKEWINRGWLKASDLK